METLLIVDDEVANLQKLKRTFLDEYVVLEATSGEEALDLLRQQSVSAIITDQRMPTMTGVEFLRESLQVTPDAVRVILTGYTGVDDLMNAINQGHVHRYVTKPWDPVTLRHSIKQEIEHLRVRRENIRLSEKLQKVNALLHRENKQLRQAVESLKDSGSEIIFESYEMQQLLELVDRVVGTDSTVLIHGETGKELLARYIHQNSPRQAAGFVAVNCGAIPHDLIESAFFGHRKGAYTGATEASKGFLGQAEGGTIFLDEIGEAPMELQVKLLRVLQEREIIPVGATQAEEVDVRVIASTNRRLDQMVEEQRFRADLFYRLNVFSITVPPLRARLLDVEVLAPFFLERACIRMKKLPVRINRKTMKLLQSYEWPGNVRELENEMERLAILCRSESEIDSAQLANRIQHSEPPRPSREGLKGQVGELEKRLILEALERHSNNKSRAAAALGITRQTIIAKLKQYQLNR